MIKVFKIGGNVVDNEDLLRKFCSDFASIEGPKVIVHGGGVMASRLQKALGQEPKMVEGRRVTDEDALQAVTMVYAGWCNKHITALLQAEGVNAIGLSGCDASVITASKRAPKTLSDGVTVVDYGFVGDVTPQSVNARFICSLLEQGIVPVFCAINHDGKGNLLNTNADTVAASVAAALKAQMVYCFELEGVMRDIKDPSSVISSIDPAGFEKLKEEGVIAGGMLPKIENSFKALRGGASSVVIKCSADVALDGKGTLLIL